LNTSTAFLAAPLFQFFPGLRSQITLEVHRQHLKRCAVKNFSYNVLRVDVTLAVGELSQKSCSNVNISAAAVPKGFLAKQSNAFKFDLQRQLTNRYF